MKALVLTIVQSCNRSCYYCTMKDYIYPLDHEFPFRRNGELTNVNCITNDALLKWLDAYIDPKEWVIKITGGEPGLYKEIDTLIPELNNRGYYGIIETNGSLPIPKSANFTIATAWHEGVQDCPKYYDIILIIKNPRDDWRRKVDYCKAHNIPYKTVPFNREFEGVKKSLDSAPGKPKLPITDMLCMYSMGQFHPCPTYKVTFQYDIFNMTEPYITPCCPSCPTTAGLELFLPDDVRAKFLV